MKTNFKTINNDILNKPFNNLLIDNENNENMKNEIYLLENMFYTIIINENENEKLKKKFIEKKIQYNIDGKSIFLKESKPFITLPANIRDTITNDFRMFMIKKTLAGDGEKDILYINKFEFDDMESEFHKEGYKKDGTKYDVDNEIGKDKDKSIDNTIGISKSPGGR